MYRVYVRTDEAGRITAVNSDEFLQDTSQWIQIDKGYGDRYRHAQGNYFPLPIRDERGIYRYKLEDGKAVPRSMEEMEGDYAPPGKVPTTKERMDEIETAMMELAAMIGGEG